MLCKPARMLRLDGEDGTGVAATGARATLLLFVVFDGFDEGGSFSASDGCGDGEGEKRDRVRYPGKPTHPLARPATGGSDGC